MRVHEAILKRRSIRLFEQKEISKKKLEKLIEAARVAPSSSNLQPLEYILVNEKKLISKVFFTLAWAGYVAPKRNPPEGKRPVAYIVVLVNKEIREKSYERDLGASVENILLSAVEEGIGSCWIGSIKKKKLRSILNVPKNYLIDSVIALGYPAEEPLMEEMKNSTKYYLDNFNRLHVPKRKLQDILHWNKF